VTSLFRVLIGPMFVGCSENYRCWLHSPPQTRRRVTNGTKEDDELDGKTSIGDKTPPCCDCAEVCGVVDPVPPLLPAHTPLLSPLTTMKVTTTIYLYNV